jgi:CDP-glucose 4,6-dehydratase
LYFETTFDQTFRNKTVFITGHTGFIGTWLSLWLQSMGANIIGYSLEPPTTPSIFESTNLEKYITHVIGDIRNKTKLSDTLSYHNPEFVFHLAAQPLVRQSYEQPVETFDTNVMGTVNLLDSLRSLSSVRTCIVMTSDKCYANNESDHAYVETDPMGGYDPYSASKGATELVVSSFRNSFFNPIDIENHNLSLATVRAGNVIGGGDWATDRIIPDCIRSLQSSKPITIRNPNAIRPWQHVLEPISGIFALTTKIQNDPGPFSESWNFGPTDIKKVPVKEIVTQIISKWGNGNWIDASMETSNKHESNFLQLNSSKSVSRLEWNSVYDIPEAINETIDWYRTYLEKDTDMNKFTLTQIQNFIQKAKQMNIKWSN